jgi:hypothetical protein
MKRACYKTAETFVANCPSHGAAAGQVPGKIQKRGDDENSEWKLVRVCSVGGQFIGENLAAGIGSFSFRMPNGKACERTERFGKR